MSLSCFELLLIRTLKELVNLCLSGKAVSNVFDGNMELDSGGDMKVIRYALISIN